MINRHNFESIKINQKNIEVVSINQRNFESTVRNRHNFEIVVYEQVQTSDSWTITFVQTSQMIAVPNLEKYSNNLEISSSTSIIFDMTLTQNMFVEIGSISNIEITMDFDGNMDSIEFSSESGFESVLKQKINIHVIGEIANVHSIELIPTCKKYFVLDNFSGSLLSDLDAMNLVDMDYELV